MSKRIAYRSYCRRISREEGKKERSKTTRRVTNATRRTSGSTRLRKKALIDYLYSPLLRVLVIRDAYAVCYRAWSEAATRKQLVHYIERAHDQRVFAFHHKRTLRGRRRYSKKSFFFSLNLATYIRENILLLRKAIT